MKNQTNVQDLINRSGEYTFKVQPVNYERLAEEIIGRAYNQYRIHIERNHFYKVFKQLDHLTDEPGEPRLFKRIQKIWKSYQDKPAEDYERITYNLSQDLANITAQAQKDLIKSYQVKIYWRTTNDIQNLCETGTSHGYGNPSSCWYTDYKPHAPFTLEQEDGIALLISDKPEVTQETGTGRIFIINGSRINNAITTFNPYLDQSPHLTELSTSQKNEIFAEIITTQLLNLKKTGENQFIDEEENSSYGFEPSDVGDSDTIYINGGTPQTLLKSEELSTPDNPRTYRDFAHQFADHYSPDIEKGFYCENCGDYITDDYDVYYSPDGEPLCSYCYNDNYVQCYHCGETIEQDEALYNDNGTPHCEDCFNELYTYCTDCGEVTRINEIIEHDEDEYCTYCYNQNFKTCELCGSVNQIDQMTITEDDLTLCEDCKKIITAEQIKEIHERKAPYILHLTGYTYTSQTNQVSETKEYEDIDEALLRFQFYNQLNNIVIVKLTKNNQVIAVEKHPDHIRR